MRGSDALTRVAQEDAVAKLELFISHRTTEAKFADLLRRRLAEDFIGIPQLFISTDISSVPAGTQWYSELLAGMRRAEIMLVLCSRHSVALPWINYEAGGGCARGIDVIPLCHSGMTPADLPLPLSMLEGIVLSDPRHLEKLYTRLSERIGCHLPKADFAAIGEQFQQLEREYDGQLRAEHDAAKRVNNESIVQNPHVVCVSSDQYLELFHRNDLQIVLDAFPANLRHDIVTTAARFEEVLSEPVDIVHIAAYVCPRTGTLFFNPVELPLGTSVPGVKEDFIKAELLELLLQTAGTKLVVIASGDSLALATRLVAFTNVIAPSGIFSTSGLARWVAEFYSRLRHHPIGVACRMANVQSQISMRLLSKQVETSLAFVESETETRGPA